MDRESGMKLFVALPRNIRNEVFKDFSDSIKADSLKELSESDKVDTLRFLSVDELTDLFDYFSDEGKKNFLEKPGLISGLFLSAYLKTSKIRSVPV